MSHSLSSTPHQLYEGMIYYLISRPPTIADYIHFCHCEAVDASVIFKNLLYVYMHFIQKGVYFCYQSAQPDLSPLAGLLQRPIGGRFAANGSLVLFGLPDRSWLLSYIIDLLSLMHNVPISDAQRPISDAHDTLISDRPQFHHILYLCQLFDISVVFACV